MRKKESHGSLQAKKWNNAIAKRASFSVRKRGKKLKISETGKAQFSGKAVLCKK
jgi:hypothetical protein